ncbi:glycoside hydrolase family 113 [Lutibacter citreus]|uniref:glycoside hydrolase family 113 n=1 Tax=Lutibacter citreus TaxID=2138210 RepID=UPI001FEA0B24|nr:glycoside hydrolase [Lutibacter citreus]
MKHFWIFILILINIKASLGCENSNEALAFTNPTIKYNGLSLTSTKNPLEKNHVEHITTVNSNAITLMPFAFLQSLNSPNVRFNEDWQWFGETSKGIEQYIDQLKKHHLKIMLKPQLWVKRGDYTGLIIMNSEEDWITLETSYKAYILEFARIAEKHNIEILCIGTELEKFVSDRTEFWSQLISEIKKIYNGKLTYAANWDEYNKIPIWEHLDYIGIDAYFPLNNVKTPNKTDLKTAWQPHKNEIIKVNSLYNKPILFTEFGYRSIDYTTHKPWDSSHIEGMFNSEAQAIALVAIYNEFWVETWFAGGFLWKWHPNHSNSGGNENNRFTLQNKPAEELLKQLYAN